MSTTKPEESARNDARDAILLKKLQAYLKSDDLYKKVGGLSGVNRKYRSYKHTALTNAARVLVISSSRHNVLLTSITLASLIPTNILLAGSQKPNWYQQRAESTEVANSSGVSLYRRNT